MEPFGLFAFLQNLLDPKSDSAENSPPPEQTKPTDATRSEPSNAEKKNPAAAFLEQHERRAGRR